MSGDTDGSGVDSSSLSHPAVPVVLGVIVVLGGGYLFVSGMLATANAEPVDATVVSSDVLRTDQVAGVDESKEYTIRVEYRYTVDGETYTSTSWCPGAGTSCRPKSDFRTELESTLEDYPEGETVTAYVPSGDPDGSFLVETGPSYSYLIVIGFGVLLVGLGGKRLVDS